MSYQVLARKWRPKNFQEIVGQEHVLRMLTNALDNQRLHHAYLFTGTRGVGKTTLARILAKCLNCEQGISGSPCGQCNICEAVDSGRFLDLIEIDAASRTKVEDTREILDNVQYAPSQGRYKIYLIDEVHMLSGHSFNALLKTLEEPPAHVKFLLATTDPKRLPITILSRCLQFNLKRIPVEQIEQQLQQICEKENITFEASALGLLAHSADGSIRDALSLLDQAIAFCRSHITSKQTREMLGSIEHDALYRLLEALAKKEGLALLTEIRQLTEHTPDFNQVLEDLLSLLHQLSLAQLIGEASDHTESIKSLANHFSAEEIQLYYQIALIGRRDLPFAPTPAQGFEMTMLRMFAFTPAKINDENPNLIPTQKNPALEKNSVELSPRSFQQKTQAASVGEITEPPPKLTNHPSPKPKLTDIQNWAEVLPKLQLTGLAQALASNCTLVTVTNTHIVLALAKKHEAMMNKKLQERIEQALAAYFEKPLRLEFKITSDEIQTPAKLQKQEQITRHANATEAIKNDSTVKKMLDVFGGSIDMDSVKAV